MSARSVLALAALSSTLFASAPASAYTLNGTIRDFCNPACGSVAAHPDFEGSIGGLVTGIVSSTLGGDGKPVFVGQPNDSIEDATSFSRWYNTTAGWNVAAPLAIDLTDPDNNGVYTYIDSSFFPIDNQLLGNQDRSHNYHFTFEVAGTFGYKAGTSQVFSFTGDDDLWVFINNKLAIDLGGVHGAASASVNLDTIAGSFGLVNNQNYNISIFFAERHTSESNFKIETSLEIVTPPQEVPEPSTYALMLAGLGMLGFMARRRMKA